MRLIRTACSAPRASFVHFALLSGSLMSGCASNHGNPRAPQNPEPPLETAARDSPPVPADPGSTRTQIDSAYRIPESPNGCGRGMRRVGSFCIDSYEAHLVLVGTQAPYPFNRPVRGAVVEARSAAGPFPQGHISQVESESACIRAGKRLCTKAEWQSACSGLGNTLFPYGEDYRHGYCNSRRVHPPSQLFGADYRNHLNDPELNLFPGGLARSGSHPRCSSDYGVFDMVGNLHEWVSDRLIVGGAVRGVFMGGFYSNDHENGYGCNYTTTAHEPSHYDYSTGFRCCSGMR